MIDRITLESELIDIARFARLARYVNDNMDNDGFAAGRLDAMMDMLTNEIFAMEKRIMEMMHPTKLAANDTEVEA